MLLLLVFLVILYHLILLLLFHLVILIYLHRFTVISFVTDVFGDVYNTSTSPFGFVFILYPSGKFPFGTTSTEYVFSFPSKSVLSKSVNLAVSPLFIVTDFSGVTFTPFFFNLTINDISFPPFLFIVFSKFIFGIK